MNRSPALVERPPAVDVLDDGDGSDDSPSAALDMLRRLFAQRPARPVSKAPRVPPIARASQSAAKPQVRPVKQTQPRLMPPRSTNGLPGPDVVTAVPPGATWQRPAQLVYACDRHAVAVPGPAKLWQPLGQSGFVSIMPICPDCRSGGPARVMPWPAARSGRR